MQTVAVLPHMRRRNGAPVAARLERLRSHVGSLAAYPSVKGAQERARGLLVPQLLDATPPVAYATAVLTGYVAGDYVPIYVVGAVLLLLRLSPWLAFTAGTVLAMMVGTDAPAMLLTVYASVYLCRRRVAGRLSWAAAVATLACLPWAFQQFGEFGPYSSTQPEALLGLLSALSAAEIARTVSAKQRLEQETMTLQEQGRAREERADRLDQRSRLARELHDVVGHHVTAMVVQAEAGLARGSEQATTSLHRIADLGRSALNDLDTMVHALREPDEGIAWTSAPRITDLPRLADPLEDSGVSVRLQVGDDLNLDAAQELTVYRIVQESLTNVLRHASARQAWVDLQHDDRNVHIRVSDDGVGRPSDQTRGSGLRGIDERVNAHRGLWTCSERPGGGTSIDVFLPVEPRVTDSPQP